MMQCGRLIVEGINDVHVIKHLCQNTGVQLSFDFNEKPQGFENARDVFELSLKDDSIDRLGIVVDADIDISSRWTSLRNILSAKGYTTPANIESIGLVLQDDTRIVPFVGVWIMPDNKIPGILEDFVQYLIPENDTLRDYSLECVKKLPEKRFKDSYYSKAEIHTWLAWQEEPGTPMGLAVTKKYLSNIDSAKTFIHMVESPLQQILLRWRVT
jgi:hypothetical protein